MIENIYLLTVCSFLTLGGFFIWQGFCVKEGSSITWNQIGNKMTRCFQDQGTEEYFRKAGIPLSMAQYTAIRNGIMLFCLILFIVMSLLHGMASSRGFFFLLFIGYFLSRPVESWGKKKRSTLFHWVLEQFRKLHLEKKDQELVKVVAQLKNLLLTKNQASFSADYILEVLMRYTKINKSIFVQTLTYVRLGDMNGAYRFFQSEFGTKWGEAFAEILLKLNTLEPVEFLKQIESLQLGFQEEQRTKQSKKQEAAGNKMYLLASLLVCCILFDYMYIIFANLLGQMNF